MPEYEKVKQFQWSLNPLVLSMNGVGFFLNFSEKPLSRNTRAMIFLLGCCIILANFIINGPRGIEISNLEWMEDVKNYESPFAYFKKNPFGIVRLVRNISDMIFFCYVPIIHFAFMATTLLDPNWKQLMLFIQVIQQKMKLSEEFYQKCRRQCYVGLFLLLVASFIYILVIIF